MKHLFLIVVAVLLTASAQAQSPEKMSYQAVVRNSTNNLVVSQTVGMQISLLQTSASGTAVYVETHSPTTNANGLVTIEIGSGTVVSGSMSGIDWTAGPYFIQTETDPTGGTTYTITGTSQLMSVPYALHAKTATTATNVTNDLVNDADSDPNNEIQALSMSNDTVYLSNGGYVKLPAGFSGDYNDLTNQPTIPTVPTTVSSFTNDAGYMTSFTEVDGSISNELQTISKTGSDITLSNTGGMITLNDDIATNELQTMSASYFGDTLYLSMGNFLIIPGISGANGGLATCPATFTDSRDGRIYPVVPIGNQCWMASNLDYNAAGSQLNPANPTSAYGRLYDWSTVMAGSGSSAGNPSGVQGICPSGWHLPSDSEWNELEMALGMSAVDTANTGWRGTDHGTKMKSTTGWNSSGNGTNASGFNAFPAGNYSSGSFFNLGDYAYFWSSAEGSGSGAWGRALVSGGATVNRYNYNKTSGFSCRCVED